MTKPVSGAWVCVVCGFVHRDGEAPEVCPVCGAPASEFEPYTDDASSSEAVPARRWRCLVCGYIHDGDMPPDSCMVCAAPSEDFEACEETTVAPSVAETTRRIVIIGAGVAGVSAAEAARQTTPRAGIVLLSHEERLPYYRLNLTRRLAGEINDEELVMRPESWYEQNNIELRLGAEVTRITPRAHALVLEDGAELSYDKLILACGAHPFVPPIPGAELKGVTAIRTLDDVHSLLKSLDAGDPCVCIGGGILGLETAGALAMRGVGVILIEGFGHLLPRQLNPDAARFLQRRVEALGIQTRFNDAVQSLEGVDAVEAAILADGTRLDARAVTITTGVRANTHLARRAGLTVAQGIQVDVRMQTSDPDILAAGDCAEYAGVVCGLWEPAQFQGVIAGRNAAGLETEFGGIPRMNTLKVLGVKLFSMGVVTPEDGGYVEVAEETPEHYHRFLFRDGRLVGAILAGDTSLTVAVTRAARERTDCSALLVAKPSAKDVSRFLSEHK